MDSLLREESAISDANQNESKPDDRLASSGYCLAVSHFSLSINNILFDYDDDDRTTIYLLRKRKCEREQEGKGNAPTFGHEILFFGWHEENRSFCARQVKLRLTQHSVAVIVRKRAWAFPLLPLPTIQLEVEAEIYPGYVVVVVVVFVVSSSSLFNLQFAFSIPEELAEKHVRFSPGSRANGASLT